MKRFIVLFLSILLICYLLSACSDTSVSVDPTDLSTVADPFNPIPTATTKDTQSDITPESTQSDSLPPLLNKPTQTLGGGIGLANEVQQDTDGAYIIYEGNEMHLFLRFTFTGYSEIGAGVHLFVDGQPQPYYTQDNNTYSYMHTVYPPNGKEYIMELIFVPVSGEAGDTLEFAFYVVTYPDYFLDDAWTGNAQTEGGEYMGISFRVKYQETPPDAQIVSVPDRVLAVRLTHTDLSSSEAAGGVSQEDVAYKFSVNGKANFGNFWNVKETDTVTVCFELKGSSLAQFGLVVYYNHEPVSVLSEERMYVYTHNGQKAILEAEIDLSGFDGEGVLYAVLVPRNYRIAQLGSSCMLAATGTYYFSGASSLEELT